VIVATACKPHLHKQFHGVCVPMCSSTLQRRYIAIQKYRLSRISQLQPQVGHNLLLGAVSTA
jgi:hypothetical protein